MENIKGYEEFVNEEFNWKKAAAGAALVGTMAMGASSCGPDTVAFNVNKKAPIEMEKSDNIGKVISVRDIRRTVGKSRKHRNVFLIAFGNKTVYKVVAERGWPWDKEIKVGDEVRLVLEGNGGYIEFEGKKYD